MGVVVIKELIFNSSNLVAGVVFFKEHIFNSVYFGVEGVVVLKELIFNSLYLGGCGDFERTDF